MSTNVPMYGFGGGSGTGCTLTVTAPAGSTVTVTKDGKTKTRTAGADGVVVFRGLRSGAWILSITDGTQTASKPVDIVADYATTITFFSATINITYPAGSVCTVTDGTTTLTAPDTSGIWDCVVQNAGTWTVTLTDKGWSDAVTVTDDKSTVNLDITKLWLYKHGDERLSVTNGWVHRRRVSSFWSADGTSTKNSESATVATTTGTNYSSASGLVTYQAIDLTNISRIYANVSAFRRSVSGDANMGGLMILSTEEVMQFGQGDVAHSLFAGTGLDSIDVSALSGYYYVGIIVSADKSLNTGAYCSLTFTEVYAV